MTFLAGGCSAETAIGTDRSIGSGPPSDLCLAAVEHLAECRTLETGEAELSELEIEAEAHAVCPDLSDADVMALQATPCEELQTEADPWETEPSAAATALGQRACVVTCRTRSRDVASGRGTDPSLGVACGRAQGRALAALAEGGVTAAEQRQASCCPTFSGPPGRFGYNCRLGLNGSESF